MTTSRADYGHLFWPLHNIDAHPDPQLQLIVMSAHLSATFDLPCVDVSLRQRGHTRAANNILHTRATPVNIVRQTRRACEASFVEAARQTVNPYGDGQASARIFDRLAGAPDPEILLHSRALPLHEHLCAFRQGRW